MTPHTTLRAALPPAHLQRRASALTLRLDAAFLCVAGSAALALELAAHFYAVGPQRAAFGGHSWATIGFAEAHGLAIIIAVLLARAASRPGREGHALALCVHLLLGSANLLFWNDAFVAMDLLPVGVVTTTLHGVFVAANGWWLSRRVAGPAERVAVFK